MLIAHFAVPLLGAVLVAINTRLSAAEIEYIVEHSGSSLLVADAGVLAGLGDFDPKIEEMVVLLDGPGTLPAGATAYEAFLERGSEQPLPLRVDDEHRPISINYTSGTTGRPKGVRLHPPRRLSERAGRADSLPPHPGSVYLWTLPMFHCNGWCTTWAITGIGGTNVCLRAVEPAAVWELIESEGVTHLNAAPTVLISLANHPAATALRDGPSR